MPFGCYPVVVLKCDAVYMYLQFIQPWLLLWKLSKLKDHYTWYMYGIYHAYTWYMSCIYKVFLICSFAGQFLFPIISCFNIRLSSTMALVYSIELHIIWNPDHLDRIGQTCTYVSEHGTDMYVHVHTCSWKHKRVRTCLYLEHEYI